MEKNQLNFNAPLISARRYSSPVRSSEKVPKTNTEKPLKSRQTSLPTQQSSWELTEVVKPGTVPFLWEKIPGKAKKENQPESQTNTPRLPPQYTPKNISGNLLEMMKKGANTDCENNQENGDDSYSDALDALSFSDSRSMNCSISGLSGYYGSDIKSYADVDTRDFMMNRFLPAAKAMVLKTPQYSNSKKQNVVYEQSKEHVKKVAIVEYRPRVERNTSHIVPDYGQYKVEAETESENGLDDEFVDFKKTPRKVFGFFSKFCLKNSLGLLNPVPGIKAKIGSSPIGTPKKGSDKKKPAKEVGKIIRKAYSGPLTQISDKHSGNIYNRKRSDSISRSQELYTVKSKPTNDSPRLSHSGEIRTTRSSSPYRSYTRGGLSPYRNEIPTSPFRKNTSFIGVTKNGEKLNVVKNPIIPKIEKIIHTDHVQVNPIETRNEVVLKADDEDTADVVTLHPPLPKSPSESWLWRTLPSISYSKNKQAKASKTGTKWETIVKTSNVHHDHVRYSEELVPHLSQHRKN